LANDQSSPPEVKVYRPLEVPMAKRAVDPGGLADEDHMVVGLDSKVMPGLSSRKFSITET
jgi:hypothetical protein